jgi:hypothetical protein
LTEWWHALWARLEKQTAVHPVRKTLKEARLPRDILLLGLPEQLIEPGFLARLHLGELVIGRGPGR